MTDSILEDLEVPRDLSIAFKCEQCPADFFINILIATLKQKVTNLYIDNGDINFDRLEINLYNYSFYYDKEGGSLFSGGRLVRYFEAAVFATLYNKNSKVLWQKDYSDKYSEEIEWNEARDLQNREGNVFDTSLPSANRNRIWEPLIITGLLGGLVYLFFASR